MRKLITQLTKQLHRSESGFTLVELLVVVGIIVALAAVIIPNVARFTGKGTEGAYTAEAENVQTAFDTIMADTGVGSIDGRVSPAVVVSDFTLSGGLPTGPSATQLFDSNNNPVDLTDYLRGNPTTGFYCWNTGGLIFSDSTWTSSTTCP